MGVPELGVSEFFSRISPDSAGTPEFVDARTNVSKSDVARPGCSPDRATVTSGTRRPDIQSLMTQRYLKSSPGLMFCSVS